MQQPAAVFKSPNFYVFEVVISHNQIDISRMLILHATMYCFYCLMTALGLGLAAPTIKN